ncbi:MAG: metallophosphoesterase [Rhizomicrobium sp.]
MRIAYLSDLHMEFENAAGRGAAQPSSSLLASALQHALVPAKGADLVLLAGDIDVGVAAIVQADAISHHIGGPVVCVAGNHEAYGQDLAALLPRMRSAAWETDGRVIFLDCSVVRLWFKGRAVCVLGCTLWTDYALNGDASAAMQSADKEMSDHQEIGWNGGVFHPTDALALHRNHRAWLSAQIRKLNEETPRPEILIVTHHAPCRDAIGERVLSLGPSYGSDMSRELSAWAPLTWIHGHTHHRHLTKIGDAMIASAPRGYPGQAHGLGGYTCGLLIL